MACDSFTSILIHADGTNTSTSFPDASVYGNTVTAVGNCQNTTAQFAPITGSTASALFDGTGDYLTTPTGSLFDFGTGDFTFDTWVRFNSIAATETLLSLGSYGTAGILLIATGAVLTAYVNSGTPTKSETWVPSTNTWYHVALVRSGTSLMMFVDGTQIGTPTTNSSDITGTTGVVAFGRDVPDSLFDLNGWMDEIRVSKGIARWTTNFTPPTVEYCLAQPDPFSFTDQSGVTRNVVITSDSIMLSGGFTNASATCSAGITFSINAGAYGTTASGINSGDTITLRITSSPSYLTAVNGNVTVGTTQSSTWTVTTGSPAGSGGNGGAINLLLLGVG